MNQDAVQVLAVIGSLQRESSTRTVMEEAARLLTARGCAVDVLDLHREPLAIFHPEDSRKASEFPALQARVERADALLLGTPDYHGSMSGAMKNFLDHFWREFAGKLFASIVVSHEKGLTATDQLRTVARQCYAWSMPYGVSFAADEEIKNGEVTGAALRGRLEMFARDIAIYGALLARQRQADLAGTEPGFLARHRPGRK